VAYIDIFKSGFYYRMML